MKSISRQVRSYPFAILVVMAAVLSTGTWFYHTRHAFAASEPEPLEAVPPSVEVALLKESRIRHWESFSGRLQAVDQVQVRPRVGGSIQKVLFREGAVVKAGDPLFVIDPRPFEAAVANAEANLASARSEAALARTELTRSKRLIQKKIISQSVYDAQVNGCKVALAAVKGAEAALKQARLNLEYAHITAPVSGRIGRAEITVGNVVQAGLNAPVLTTIVSNDRLYAEFDIDEQTYVKTVRQMTADNTPPVELALAGDHSKVYRGTLHAFDNRLDAASGTIRARAVFENTDGALLAGMFAKIRLGSAYKERALLVPERAIGTNQDQKFVYTIGEDNKVTYRAIKPGRTLLNQRVVLSGLAEGDQVVINGLHRVRPEMRVQPVVTDTRQNPSEEERVAVNG